MLCVVLDLDTELQRAATGRGGALDQRQHAGGPLPEADHIEVMDANAPNSSSHTAARSASIHFAQRSRISGRVRRRGSNSSAMKA